MVSETIEKIRKLLALSKGNTFEEEANSALLMAQKLMAKEGISEEDIKKQSRDEELGKLGEFWLNRGEEKRLLSWRKILMGAICRLFDCRVVLYTNQGKTKAKIIGREGNRVTAEIMYNWICDKAMKEAKDKFGGATAKRNAYCIGVADSISIKVSKIKPADAKLTDAWGIVPLDEVDAYVSATIGKTTTTSIKKTVSDRDAYVGGRISGEETSLNKQFGLKCISA